MSSLKDKKLAGVCEICDKVDHPIPCYQAKDVDLAVAELKQVLSDCHDKGSIDVGFAIEIIDRIFGEDVSK